MRKKKEEKTFRSKRIAKLHTDKIFSQVQESKAFKDLPKDMRDEDQN